MNEVAQKVYELLLTKPEWFDMGKHHNCILGAAFRIVEGRVPDFVNDDFYLGEYGAALLEVAHSTFFIFTDGDRYDALFHAERFRVECEAEQRMKMLEKARKSQ